MLFKTDTFGEHIPLSFTLFIAHMWLAALLGCSIISYVLRGMEGFRASGSSNPAGLSHKPYLLLSKFPKSAWNSQGIKGEHRAGTK